MAKELERWSNQKRFIQMIIDGTLIVAKKKKDVLVQELRDKKFTPVPKTIESIKEKEEDPMDDEVEAEEVDNVETGAADYDYLLGVSRNANHEISD